MEDITEDKTLPAWLKQIASLILTVLAALLYAAILGSAVVRTFMEGSPTFTANALRAASVLSGFVGAVVTAGFARGRRLTVTPVGIAHPMGGKAVAAWTSTTPASRIKSKLVGLAATLGLRVKPALPQQPAPHDAEQPEPKKAFPAAVWVALLYLLVYFLVGASAFALTILRPEVPELIGNAAWVWLGTLVSSGYTFFGLN